MSLGVRGRFGYSNGYGAIKFGDNAFGLLTEYAGIYSRKKLRKGWGLSRMTHYRPTNPRTTAQQAWRALFADAMASYALLTSDQKALLSKEGRKVGLIGYNLFVRRYLQSHRT